MKVIGFNFKKISIEKKKDISSNVNLNFNIDIKDVKQPKIDIFQGKNLFSFEYEFKLKYEPDYAEIIFHGDFLVLIEENKLAKEIEKEWKNKRIPDEVSIPLHNIIIARCNLKALQLEEDLGLPTHSPYPKVSKPKEPN